MVPQNRQSSECRTMLLRTLSFLRRAQASKLGGHQLCRDAMEEDESQMAERAEISTLTQRRRGRRVLFEHGLNGLNGLILFLEFTNDVFNDVQITEGVKERGGIVQ